MTVEQNPLVYPMNISFEINSVFQWVNFSFLMLSIAFLWLIFNQKKEVIYRPSFVFPALICIFYQFPLFLFSNSVEHGLVHHYLFSFITHGFILSQLIYVYFTLNWTGDSSHYSFTRVEQYRPSNWLIFIFFALSILIVSIFLYYIPWPCTGLYSMLFDTEYLYLARELSLKIVSYPLPIRLFGIFTNVISPIVVGLSLIRLQESWRNKRIGITLGWFSLIFIQIVLVMISGIKSILLPIFIFIFVISSVTEQSLWKKVLKGLIYGCLFLTTVLLFSVFKEQFKGFSKHRHYPVGLCIAKAGKCQEGEVLINSLFYRHRSLDLSDKTMLSVKKELDKFCHLDKSIVPISIELHNKIEALEQQEVSNTLVEIPHLSFDYRLHLLFYRAFGVPFQVSGWYFLYHEQHMQTDYHFLSFLNRTSARFIPALDVYQAYGAIYSSGDRTSTSTAPTSFLYLLSAFMGFIGFIIASVLWCIFDMSILFFYQRARGINLLILIGLVMIACFNLLVSDFMPVLFSHGAIAIPLVYILVNWMQKRDKT